MNSVSPAKCDLCGSVVGRGAVHRTLDAAERSFCCAGCANVFSILLESGAVSAGRDLRETDLYRQSLKLRLISQPESEPTPSAPPGPAEEGLKESLFQLSGLWCSSCGWVIEKALTAEPGVHSAEVLFASDLLKVRYSPKRLPPGRIERRVEGLGYGCVAYFPQKPADGAERRDLLLRVGIAAFVWTNVMYLSLVLYVGYFESVTPSARRLVPFILMMLAAVAVFYSAYPILRAAWMGLRERTIRVETLLGLGILSAWGYSSVQAFVGGQHFYFDTACAIVTLVLAGKLIEKGARERTARAVSSLYRMMPRKARVVDHDKEHFVSVETLADGTMFLVKAGETIPADGIVVEGNSHVDESILTGESFPVSKEPGSTVACGSTNGAGVIQVRATRTGDRTALSQVIGMVERAISTRSALERQADRISRIFVPLVTLISVATFAGALFLEAAGPALMRAITVLVVACPCALGIATPLAVTAAIGAASRRGILVSDPRVLETLTKLDTVIFDKTGTVTEGRFLLQDHAVSSTQDRFETDHLPIIASLERYSEHPLGRAVVESATTSGTVLMEASGIEIHEGAGIKGVVGGRNVFVGNRKLPTVAENLIPAELETRAAAWAGEGKTVAFYGWNGAIHGALAFGDRVKPAASRVFAALRASGVRTSIVSGDTDAAVAHAAAAVGADEYRAACTPRDKEEVIRDLKARGRVVAMVGDGVNDAPALALADLGIAMGSGTDVAMRAAPVTLMTSDLGRIPEIFSLARRTVRIVRQNLFWAFFYNTAGISLAILGVLNPIAAAAAMVVSSLTVVLNSFRASRGGVGVEM